MKRNLITTKILLNWKQHVYKNLSIKLSVWIYLPCENISLPVCLAFSLACSGVNDSSSLGSMGSKFSFSLLFLKSSTIFLR